VLGALLLILRGGLLVVRIFLFPSYVEVIYLVLMVIGYYVYGDALRDNQTILQTIKQYGKLFSYFDPSPIIYVANALVVLHLFTGKCQSFLPTQTLISHADLHCSLIPIAGGEVW
jgi:hypothetical protein